MSTRLKIHHTIFFILLTLLAGSQAVSNWMMSGMEILLAANWLLEWDMRAKIQRAKRQPLLTAWLVFALVYIIWFIPGSNYSFGLSDLFGKLPLLAIPLIVLTSQPLSRKKFSFLIAFYIATVFVATIIGHVRCQTIPDLPYRQIIPFISHIRFSLNVCLCIVFLSYFLFRTPFSIPRALLAVFLILHFLWFLLLIRSYTGICILLFTALLILFFYSRRISNVALRRSLLILYSLGLLAVAVTAACLIRDYYRPVPLVQQPMRTCTVNGNPYQHKNDGLIENGNLVNNYVCPQELEHYWPNISSTPIYQTTPNGYTVYPTLIRYLNALGTTKDSAGLAQLSPDDVSAIEKGIANPVYVNGGTLRKMTYVLLYEYESSKALGSVAGFSLLQRFHLWKCGWRAFTRHPLLGVGTCNVLDATEKELLLQQSPLMGRNLNLHNQYLAFLVTFGIIGTLLIAFFFVRALRITRILKHPLPTATLTIVLLSFLTENTLSTLAGCVFSVFFFSLFALMANKEN